MKNVLLASGIFAAVLFGGGCEPEDETVGDKIEEAGDKMGDAVDDVKDGVEDAVEEITE
ncbi:MAG: hypothetical protein DHS20C16_35040 [Phycisphaerae bacterium]|nr:MAG: hypothetical protein DHS20C16_35040 [Phycisphaerae bacterium]